MNKIKHPRKLALTVVSIIALFESPTTYATISFTGVAAGDITNDSAVIWTRAQDGNLAANLSLRLGTDPNNLNKSSFVINNLITDNQKDFTLKVPVTNLLAATTYYYQFVGLAGESSAIGKFRTPPVADKNAQVHFGFSGDMDGLMRPYALARTIPEQNFDFFINLGDVIYENASNAGNTTGTPGLNNSPSVTLSGTTPVPSATGATQAQLFNDYSKKYNEQFRPVNSGGQSSLKDFYAAQGNYTLYDNHELGNRQYINGGAPVGGPVGDMPSGAGVDARDSKNDVNRSGTFINKSLGFQTLQQVFLNYQPIADLGIIEAPADPRTDGTKKLYGSHQWGKNAIFFNVDDRSYRDIRIKTSANVDDTSAPRANNPDRTILGKTQLAELELGLLNAQNAGIIWKILAISDPIDQLGPIGGSLTLSNLPTFGTAVDSSGKAASYAPVSYDGGKSWIGGYRAERNALLKFIADHKITNVVFLSTDDHQNRVNELTYSPTDETEKQASYVKVPYTFEIVAGPLGATGPDLITNHSFTMAQQLAKSLSDAQIAAGIEPIGLQGYPGLKNVARLDDSNAANSPSSVDFYSPDTFNYNVLDIAADGVLTVKSIGITATPLNSASEYDPINNPAKEIFSFQVQPTAQTAPPVTCLLNWAETKYPTLFEPSGASFQMSSPYLYRFYKYTNSYIGISSVDNHVYYLVGNGAIQDAGLLSNWLQTAGCDK